MTRLGRKFLRDEDGISLVEGAIVIPVVLIVISAFVEFGFAVFQWNQTVKSLQLGARLAAVSDPIADTTPLLADYTGFAGDPAPGFNAADTVTCGGTDGSRPACVTDEINRLVFGSDGVCDPAYGTSKPGMCDLNPTIAPENVVVTYHRSGLGYVGRPGSAGGLILTLTVEAEGLNFDLPLLGALAGVNRVEIPAHPVSITSEDFNSCRDTCS